MKKISVEHFGAVAVGFLAIGLLVVIWTRALGIGLPTVLLAILLTAAVGTMAVGVALDMMGKLKP